MDVATGLHRCSIPYSAAVAPKKKILRKKKGKRRKKNQKKNRAVAKVRGTNRKFSRNNIHLLEKDQQLEVKKAQK